MKAAKAWAHSHFFLGNTKPCQVMIMEYTPRVLE